jgi:threonine dehydratase
VKGSIVVSLDDTRKAMRLLAENTRVICEGAGALAVAAELKQKPGTGPIVAIVSGANIDLEKLLGAGEWVRQSLTSSRTMQQSRSSRRPRRSGRIDMPVIEPASAKRTVAKLGKNE